MYGFEHNLWSTWRELQRFQGDVERQGPVLNVWHSDAGAIITAPLPGVDKDSLDISVHGENVTLRGRRTAPISERQTTYHRRETHHADFTRHVTLPFKVDPAQVEARVSCGVLQLHLPYAANDRPQRIAIKAD